MCGDLNDFTQCFASLKTGKKHAINCVACGIPASATCGLCKVALHHLASNQATKNHPPAGSSCFVDCQNTHFCRLAKCDCGLISQGNLANRKANWTHPAPRKKALKSMHIKQLFEAPVDGTDEPDDTTAVQAFSRGLPASLAGSFEWPQLFVMCKKPMLECQG